MKVPTPLVTGNDEPAGRLLAVSVIGSPSYGSVAVTANISALLSITLWLPSAAKIGGLLLPQQRGSAAVTEIAQPWAMLPASVAAASSA